MNLPKTLQQLAEVIIDSYFIVDTDRNIVDFNRAFHAMLPRALARNLKTKKCYEVLQLSICKDKCIAHECWKTGRQVRLDEITGRVAGEEGDLRFILSGIPIRSDEGQVIGAMEVQRNVTDEAIVQSKYQQQVDASARELKKLEEELQRRTKRLLEVSRRLGETQRALLRAKTDLFL
ncbi:MAG: PAS domain-containing protein [Deltaproteobacteria bacterium]|nr:PAS domain-containing protein [Deltaproteobacteria bacterium]